MSNEGGQETVVCSCSLCSGGIEFEPASVGATVQCPHCGADTVLFIPNTTVLEQKQEIETPPPPPPQPATRPKFIVTTSDTVSAHNIESYLGVVRGIVVRSPNIVQGMFGGLKQIVGGNIESYAQVCEEARRHAFERMVDHAKSLNADAIIAVRYDATEFVEGATEVLAYGTAVKLSGL